MIPENFRPLEGDNVEAKDHWSIDPDNIQPQASGYLTGGTGHSALSVFNDLAIGTNDGKFKINVDGAEYDDVGVNIPLLSSSVKVVVSQSGSDANQSGSIDLGQSFTPTKKTLLSSITFGFHNINYYSAYVVIYQGRTNSGDPIATSSVVSGGSGVGDLTFNFTGLPELTGGQEYSAIIVVSAPGSGLGIKSNSGAPYAGGQFYYNGSFNVNYDAVFSISGIELEDYQLALATAIQTAIRTATSSTETVIYDTDKFVITSATVGRDSKILKLMSPSTGTDISGNGATPYLDMADNATETLGTGEEYNLVRLNEDGILPEALLPQWLLDLKP